MVTFKKFPMSKFVKCNVKNVNELWDSRCYLLVVKLKKVKCKYYNSFISVNKCEDIKNPIVDNGRIISADEFKITLTEIDFKFILKSYNCEYEILESYSAKKDYLPKPFIEFILDKYVKKTEYKNVEGKEIEYNLEKQSFNSLYGMTVTNNNRDNVLYEPDFGWSEKELSNEQILEQLEKDEKKGFLSFSWGIYVTSIARNNLLENVLKLDKYVVYCDTDSIKLTEGFDIKVINDYNEEVKERIRKASKDLNIDIIKYMPKDIKGKSHPLGLFENETDETRKYTYDEFVTLGAKKYAVKINDEIKITVAGVPKSGAECLKSLEDFKEGFVFDYEHTNKNLLVYNDDMKPFTLTDYTGKQLKVTDKHGICLLPTTYVLGITEEYNDLIESSKRSIYKE